MSWYPTLLRYTKVKYTQTSLPVVKVKNISLPDDPLQTTFSNNAVLKREDEEANSSVDQFHQCIIVIEGNQVDSYHLDWHATSSRASTPT